MQEDEEFEEDYFQLCVPENGTGKMLEQSNASYKWLQDFIATSPFSRSIYSYSEKPNLCLQQRVAKLTDQLNHNDLDHLVYKMKQKLAQRLRKQPRTKIKFNHESKSIQEQGKYQTTVKPIISYPTVPPPIFSGSRQQQRYQCKRLIASHFISKEYSFDKLQQNLLESSKGQFMLNNVQFKGENSLLCILSEIVLQTFRITQQFMTKQFRKSPIAILKQDELQLFCLLINCKENLIKPVWQTYFKFVEMAFNLCEAVCLSKRQVIHLNNAVQQWLFAFRLAKKNKKISENGNIQSICGNQRVELITKQVVSLGSSIVRNKAQQSILKQRKYDKKDRKQFRAFISQREVEREVLTQYKSNSTVSHITAHLKHKYPQMKDLITLVEVKTKFHMILRAAYRRLIKLLKMLEPTTKMPRLITLNNSNIERVLVSPQALKVRFGLIDVWLLDQSHSNEEIKKVIEPAMVQINDYMYCCSYPELKGMKSQKISSSKDKRSKSEARSKYLEGISKAMLAQKPINQ